MFKLIKQISSVLFLSILLASCAKNITTFQGEKVRIISVERELPFPAERIWEKIFLDYGGAYKFNPGVVKSDYVGEYKSAKVGAKRYMQQDIDGKKIVYEQIEKIDPASMLMLFKIYDAKGVPINNQVTYGQSELVSIDSNRTLFKVNFYYRTKPKFLATFANSSLEKDFNNMLIGIEHHLTTGELITRENFKEIAGRYR